MVEEPEIRGGAAPDGMLDMFFPRDVPWGGNRPATPRRRICGEVPGFGYAFLPLSSAPGEDDLRAEPLVIENAHYRIRVNPRTGALEEWFDKDLGYDFAGTYRGWGIGQYVYETVEAPEDRDAIFRMDFSLEDFGTGPHDTPFGHATVEPAVVHPPVIEQGRASISAEVAGPGIRGGRCTYWLDSRVKALSVDWVLDKLHETRAEAVFIAFPFNLGQAVRFRVDLNGIACTPNEDQLPGTVRDWYPVQRWVDAGDGRGGVTLVPLDAPLAHLGGITTGRWASELTPESCAIMSWALHNHWMVNFKASQGGRIPLRYRLTTYAGACDDAAAARFGAEAATPPIVLRDRLRRGEASGRFLRIADTDGLLATAKPAEDGDGIVLRLQNLKAAPRTVRLEFDTAAPVSACLCSPVEEDGQPLAVSGRVVEAPVGARAVCTVRVRFASRPA